MSQWAKSKNTPTSEELAILRHPCYCQYKRVNKQEEVLICFEREAGNLGLNLCFSGFAGSLKSDKEKGLGPGSGNCD